jgi:hypothetical protein
VQTKHREIVQGARTRIAEYLMAAYTQRSQPATENFMLIADKGDLNPSVIDSLADAGAGRRTNVWAPWHAFAQERDQLCATSFGGPFRGAEIGPLNQFVAAAFAGAPPQSMTNVAGATRRS